MAVIFSRAIGPVAVNVVLSEAHESRLTITRNPIEAGADVTDHAYIEPKRLTLDFADAGAALTFAALVQFQESRVPFTAVSGLYVYTNMLIESLTADRDPGTALILRGRAVLSQAILVETAYAESEGEGGSSGASGKSGNAGGKKSTNAARPSSAKSGDAATADRSAGTVARGDATSAASSPSENTSALYRLKYGSAVSPGGIGSQ